MKLFIFEPYKWAYCGGAIGVIHHTFEDAVDLILKEDAERAKKEYKRNEDCGLTSNLNEEDLRYYKKEYFKQNKEEFVKDGVNQWLLTNEVELSGQYDPEPEVLFDNWNYV